MICKTCTEKLESAYAFGKKFVSLEALFFGPARALGGMHQPAGPSGTSKRKSKENIGNTAKKSRVMEKKESGRADQGTMEAAKTVETKRGIPRTALQEINGNQPSKLKVPEGMKDCRVLLDRRDAELKTEDEDDQEAQASPEEASPLSKNSSAPSSPEPLENKPRLPSMNKFYVVKTADGSYLERKKFYCNFPGCGKVFAFKCGLNQHQTSHSGNFTVLLRSSVCLFDFFPQMIDHSSATAVANTSRRNISMIIGELRLTELESKLKTLVWSFFCHFSFF
jgi:hypothetical protein